MKLRGADRGVLFIFGGAFVLSLFIGLVSGKPFGTALGRAVIASILFGAIVAGGLLLLRRSIPDLGSMINQDRQREEPGAGDAETGRMVDYTVGEGAADGAQVAAAYAGPGSRLAAQKEIGAEIGELDRLSPDDDPAGVSMPSAEIERAQVSGGVTPAGARSVKPSEEKGTGPGIRGGGSEEGDRIDEALPSLDTLFESEADAAGSADERSPEDVRVEGKRTSGRGDVISIGGARIPNEPGVMAKAIKRIMKQD